MVLTGHGFHERQPDAMLPNCLPADADIKQERHDYALSHHLLKDHDQADYFRDNDHFVMPWNSVSGKLPVT